MDWLAEGVENRADISEGTAKHYRSFAAYLLRLGIFQKFTDLTVKNVAEMDADLRKRGLGKSTIYNYHKWMRYWCGVAVREDLLAKSPYANFHCDKGHRDTIRYLTPEERDKVEALPLIGTAAMVRDMFIFSCYTGLSYSDMAKIVPEDFKHTNGRISLRSHRVKTGGLYSLTILPKAQTILERYGWRLPDISDQKCNQWLKIIQGQARITTKMTMHVARHTFATWALSEGVSVEVVSKMLGHANIATTQIYAKVLQRSVDEGFDMLAQ
jgi:site-specific recombinase XerD